VPAARLYIHRPTIFGKNVPLQAKNLKAEKMENPIIKINLIIHQIKTL
jgi:hypothetical protein